MGLLSTVLTRLGTPYAVFFILLCGCTSITLISDYDETTDKGLTKLQQNVDDFIEGLEKSAGTPDAGYAKNQTFYDGFDHDLRQLEFRVGAIPRNKQTIALVSKIRTVVLGTPVCTTDGASLRDMHCLPANKEKGPSKAALQIAERNIDQTISAALSLEIAKKQGLEKNSS